MNGGFDLQPSMIGTRIGLRPLISNDWESLYMAASDPLIWEQHPDPERFQKEVFRRNFFEGALSSCSAFVVYDLRTQEVIGSTRYYDWSPARREVAIGYTFLIRRYWGGITNAEMKQLMLEHAFRWAEKVWFHIGPDNQRSRRAVEKIGAIYSHTESKILNGTARATAFYFIDRASATKD